VLRSVDARGHGEVAADATDGAEARRALRERVGDEVLELANLVAAVRLAALVVALDPELARAGVGAEPAEPVHARREAPEGDPGDLPFERRVRLKERRRHGAAV